ncbi:unnamed protein product [Nippostrongylus brasiliensis]|uniref:Uncharacterized protein n=1 Tax=Nippostrongylus brasiliensis TaxID=27835 RepID=A0A0N4XQC5_NIPBR|nr:unnamed protein product [Nippostrongylus brasiliensis]
MEENGQFASFLNTIVNLSSNPEPKLTHHDVSSISQVYYTLFAEKLLSDRDDFLREQGKLYNELFANYTPRLAAITTIGNDSSLDGTLFPRYQVNLTLSFLKLINVVRD